MPRIDFGHFYRFLVSAGLFIVAAGLALAWFVVRELTNALPTQTQYDNVADVARDLVDTRLEHLRFASVVYPWISAVAVGGGLAIAVFGFLAWRKRQKVSDEREDLKLKRDRLLDSASQREIEAKQDQEHDEVAEEESESDTDPPALPEGPDPEPGPDDSSPTSPTSGDSAALDDESDHVPIQVPYSTSSTGSGRPPLSSREIAQREAAILDHLGLAMGEDWDLARNVKRSDPEFGQAIVDALLRPRSGAAGPFPAIAVEVKYSRVGGSRARVSDALMTLARVTRLRRRQQTVGLLIFVVDEEFAPGSIHAQLSRIEQAASEDVRLLQAPVGVLASGFYDFMGAELMLLQRRVLDTVFDALYRTRSTDQRVDD